MIKQRKIELLAPAKNLECGIEAINMVQMLYISVLRNSVPVRQL